MCNNRSSPKGGRRRGREARSRLAQPLVLKCSARITDGKRGENAVLLQPQKVFGICLAAGLGEVLSAAPKWVQQLRNGDGVPKCSPRGLEQRMASFGVQGASWIERRCPRAGEAGHRGRAKQPLGVFGEGVMAVPCSARVCSSPLPIPGYVMKDAAAAVPGRGWARTPGAGTASRALGPG